MTIQLGDVKRALGQVDRYDFLIDIVPRDGDESGKTAFKQSRYGLTQEQVEAYRLIASSSLDQ